MFYRWILLVNNKTKNFDVTEINLWLEFADVIFGRTSDSQKYVCVCKLLSSRPFNIPFFSTAWLRDCGSTSSSPITYSLFSTAWLWDHLYISNNALISGHPGGLTPGTYGGIERDLLTFVANVWPGTGVLDRFCTSEAKCTGKDPWDSEHRRHLENNERTGYYRWTASKWQRRKACKHVLRFSRKSIPFCWSSFPIIAKIFFARNRWLAIFIPQNKKK